MIEKSLDQIRNFYEKGEYYRAVDFIKSIPESPMKAGVKLWAFIFMPVSTAFHDFKLGLNFDKKLNNTTETSYLTLLIKLTTCRLLLEELSLFKKDKFSELGKILHSIEQLYTSLCSESKLPESLFLLDEVYLVYLVYKGRAIIFEKDFDKVIQYYLDGLSKAQEICSNLLIYRFFYQLGMIYQMKGDLNQGLDYSLKRLEFANKIDNHYWKMDACSHIAMFYGWKGIHEEALKYCKLGISYSDNFNDILTHKFNINLLDNLGQVQIDIGMLNEGMDNLERCKNLIYDQLNSNEKDEAFYAFSLPDILWGMFNYWFVKDNDEQCEIILSEFSNLLNKQIDMNVIKYNNCKARYLLKKGRIRDKSVAFTLLEEIINSHFVWFEVTFPSLVLLTQLLIEDYENTKDQSIIFEINSYIEHIESATQSVQIGINLAVLNSKIKLLEGNIDKAENILVDNLNLSEKYGYYYDNQTIRNELDKLREEKTKWKELFINNPNDLEKLQLQEFKNYLEDAKNIVSFKS